MDLRDATASKNFSYQDYFLAPTYFTLSLVELSHLPELCQLIL